MDKIQFNMLKKHQKLFPPYKLSLNQTEKPLKSQRTQRPPLSKELWFGFAIPILHQKLLVERIHIILLVYYINILSLAFHFIL